MDATDFEKLKALQAAHQQSKAHWYELMASPRSDDSYFDELTTASRAYTAAAEANLAFWEKSGDTD